MPSDRTQEIIQEVAARPIETPPPTPVPEAENNDEPTPEPRPMPTPKPRRPNERDINFEELWEINPDVIGWIEIPGTGVDYPFVSTLDNYYYLDIDLFGNRNHQGTIFADIRNFPDMEDPFIILYGHSMRDGTKFATLHGYLGVEDYFIENNRIIIYTPDGQLEYRIFAAYERDDEHIMGIRNFRKPDVMREHLLTLRDVAKPGSIINLDGITEADSMLVLSTCTDDDAIRLIVQAVFVAP